MLENERMTPLGWPVDPEVKMKARPVWCASSVLSSVSG